MLVVIQFDQSCTQDVINADFNYQPELHDINKKFKNNNCGS